MLGVADGVVVFGGVTDGDSERDIVSESEFVPVPVSELEDVIVELSDAEFEGVVDCVGETVSDPWVLDIVSDEE